jgi:hypothetical protein
MRDNPLSNVGTGFCADAATCRTAHRSGRRPPTTRSSATGGSAERSAQRDTLTGADHHQVVHPVGCLHQQSGDSCRGAAAGAGQERIATRPMAKTA